MATGDDLYLRDGADYTNGAYYPEAPAEQQEEEAQAKGVIAASYPIMDDVANWFDESIKDCDSISNIQFKSVTINGVKFGRSVSVEGQAFAYQLLKELLSAKRGEFAEFGGDRT